MPSDLPTRHWTHRLPGGWGPFAELSRLDRPVGYWLLALPGWVGIAFALMWREAEWSHLWLAGLILVGAIAMRGAGCTYNDIVDRDLDAQVERTRTRPLPSGRVSVRAAWAWLVAQCLVGLVVLLLLPNVLSQLVALASLPLVAAYPFMKRITGFPQVWLGLTFNWAVLVTYSAVTGEINGAALALYIGLAAWTVGYDTIYALQDIDDDALAGIKSSALSFGRYVRWGVLLFYACAYGFISDAIAFENYGRYWFQTLAEWKWLDANPLPPDVHLDTPEPFMAPRWVLIPFALHLLWQVARLRRDDPALALRLFKSNGWAGALLVLGFLAAGLASGVSSQGLESLYFQGNVISDSDIASPSGGHDRKD